MQMLAKDLSHIVFRWRLRHVSLGINVMIVHTANASALHSMRQSNVEREASNLQILNHSMPFTGAREEIEVIAPHGNGVDVHTR